MKFLIHYTIDEDYEDELIVSWEDMDEIREEVQYEMKRRWATCCWSEQIE